MAVDSAAPEGEVMKTASESTSKMTLQEAAWNVVFVNVLLNRTFLRSRQEQVQMEDTVRASFPCFEGVTSVFLNELMAIARVQRVCRPTLKQSRDTPFRYQPCSQVTSSRCRVTAWSASSSY